MDYLDFELEVGPGNGSSYPVAVLRSPGGEARATMTFPFSGLELENRLKTLQIALLRSGGSRRRVLAPEAADVEAFGRALFEALFTGDVRTRYAVSLREAVREGKGLRFKLRIQPPELAALPWEFLYDPQQADYVTLSHETPLVRYLELPGTVQPLAITAPLRILGLVASPRNLPELNVEHEKLRIERALEHAQSSGLVSLTWMDGQTWRDLQRAMRQGPWHAVHFIGHGGFDRVTDEGFIALVDEAGDAHRFSATDLGRMLTGHRSLRLVVLNACEGATGSQQDLFSSTAATLVRRGISAVLAMQYEITDGAAIELARTFYETLASGSPVDEALSEARKAISFAVANTFEWGTPVLFLRAPNGILFEIAPAPSPPPAGPPRLTPPAMPEGIAPDLYRRLHDALSRTEVFASDPALRDLFIDSRLIPWRNQLPHADSVAGRVQTIIGFLHTRQQAGTNTNALVLLLEALRDRLDEGEALHGQLGELAQELGGKAPDVGLAATAGPAALGSGTRAAEPAMPEPPTVVRPVSRAADRGKPAGLEAAAGDVPVIERSRDLVVAQAEAPRADLADALTRESVPATEPDPQMLAIRSRLLSVISQKPAQFEPPAGPVYPTFMEIRAELQARQASQAGDEQVISQKPESRPALAPTLAHTLTGYGKQVNGVAFSPDGELLVTGSGGELVSGDKSIRLWRLRDGTLVQRLDGHTSSVRQVSYSPDGTLLASASHDHTVRLWAMPGGGQQRTLQAESSLVNAVAFSADGGMLAAGCSDRKVRLWWVDDGELTATLEGHTGLVTGVTSVAFSPDGTLLASGGNDRTVRLWHLPDGAQAGLLEGHTGPVEAVAFSPDGKLLASGSDDKTIRLWQLPNREFLRALEGHENYVYGLAFSPDGRLLASASWDNTVRLWKVPSGKLVRTLKGHTGSVRTVAFSPDGRLLASGSHDKTVRIWRLYS